MIPKGEKMKIIIKLLITISLFVLLFHQFEIKLLSLVTEINNWNYLLIAVCIRLTVVSFISVNRWRFFLRVAGIRENFFVLWYINWISLFQGLLLPSTQGFDVVRIYYIEQRHPNKQGIAGSTVFIERIIGIILLCLLSLVALPFIIHSWDFLPLYLTIIAVSSMVFMALILVLNKKIYKSYSGYKFKNKIMALVFSYIDKFHGAIVYFPYRKALPISLVWIAGFQLATVFVIYLIFCAYGYAIPFIQHVAIFPVIAILSMAPITIGGFGVREGFFVFFYSLIGVPPTVALGVSILQYIILILVPAALGGLLYLWESLRGSAIGYPK